MGHPPSIPTHPHPHPPSILTHPPPTMQLVLVCFPDPGVAGGEQGLIQARGIRLQHPANGSQALGRQRQLKLAGRRVGARPQHLLRAQAGGAAQMGGGIASTV